MSNYIKKNNTVFVIGAGASREAHLPTGYELKKVISSLLDIEFDFSDQITSGDHAIAMALKSIAIANDGGFGNMKPYLEEAWHIRDALPQAISIDNFIDSQRGNEKIAICGKLGIVRSILDAEKSSILYIDPLSRKPGLDFNSLEGTWYLPFFQLLTENCEIANLEDRLKEVSLIVFNYDRCIEQFLYYAFQNYYRISEKEACHLVRMINIYHPYGCVGSLPWWHSGVEKMEFGYEPNGNQLLGLVNQIKTFTEGTAPDSSEISAIRNHMKNASRLVFLGFAFHKLNMQLISPIYQEKTRRNTPACYATTYGISESDKRVINNQISQLYGKTVDVNMGNIGCNKFFSEYWRSLSF